MHGHMDVKLENKLCNLYDTTTFTPFHKSCNMFRSSHFKIHKEVWDFTVLTRICTIVNSCNFCKYIHEFSNDGHKHTRNLQHCALNKQCSFRTVYAAINIKQVMFRMYAKAHVTFI
jgi:hypothetical protein